MSTKEQMDEGMKNFFKSGKQTSANLVKSEAVSPSLQKSRQKSPDLIIESKSKSKEKDNGIENFLKQTTSVNFSEKEKDSKLNKQGQGHKLLTSPSKSKPYGFDKLSEKDKSLQFMQFYDENLNLKKNQSKLEKDMRIMANKLHEIQSEYTHSKQLKNKHAETLQVGSGLENTETELLKRKNQQLEEKLLALASAKRIVSSTNAGQKKKHLVSTIGGSQSQKQYMGMGGDRKTEELIRVNEELRKHLQKSELQVKAMQSAIQQGGGMQGVHSQIQNRNINMASYRIQCETLDSDLKTATQKLEYTQNRLGELSKQLNDEKQRVLELERQNRVLEVQGRGSKEMEAEVESLRRTRDNLEIRLQELCSSPFIKEHEDRVTLQVKVRDLEQQLHKTRMESEIQKDLFNKNCAELSLIKKEHATLQQNYKHKLEEAASLQSELKQKDSQLAPFRDLENEQDGFIRALGQLKLMGEQPAWLRLDFLDRPTLDITSTTSLLQEIERLRLEKAELASLLEKSQTLLRTHQDVENENTKVNDAEHQKLQLQLATTLKRAEEMSKLADLRGRNTNQSPHQIVERDGVKYDDTVSVWSEDMESSILQDFQGGMNVLDMHIGDVELDETGIQQVIRLYQEQTQTRPSISINQHSANYINVKEILTFITVDFYNHDTQHSGIACGLHTSFNFTLGYKVACDQTFIAYLEQHSARVDLYASVNQEAIKLGSADIPLLQLIEKNNVPNVSGVVNGAATFHGLNNQMLMGVLQYRLRMRFPISESIKWVKEKRAMGLLDDAFILQQDGQVESLRQRKKLVVIVDKATGLQPKSQSFVNYTLCNSDYYTSTQPGTLPRWDYHGVHEIVYDTNFVAFMRNNFLEFNIFDDSVPLSMNMQATQQSSMMMMQQQQLQQSQMAGQSDFVGTAKLSISGLAHNETIDNVLEIISSRGQKIGTLHVKIFWYQGDRPAQPQAQESLVTKTWEQEFAIRVATQLRAKGLNIESAFLIFDQDRDNIISEQDFRNTLLFTLQMAAHQDEITLFYSKLQKPVTQRVFTVTFVPYLPAPVTLQKSNLNEIMHNLSINSNILLQQDAELQKIRLALGKAFINQLKTKTEIQVFKSLDIDGDGYISLLELKAFLLSIDMNGIDYKLTDAGLLRFLKTVDQNNDNKINIKEFFQYCVGPLQEVKKEIAQKRQDQPQPQKSAEETLIDTVFKEMFNYMRNKKFSFFKLFVEMDNNNDNFLSRKELSDFIRTKLQLKLSSQDDRAVLNYFDKNGDDKLTVKEFIDCLKQRALSSSASQSQRDVFQRKKEGGSPSPTLPPQTLSQKIVAALAQHIKQSNTQMSTLFNQMDKDKNGFINREELLRFVTQTCRLQLTRNEQNELFECFDADMDNRISIREFSSVFTPALQKAQESQSPSLKTSQNLQNILSDDSPVHEQMSYIYKQNRTIISSQFKMNQDMSHSECVSKADFNRIVRQAQENVPMQQHLTTAQLDKVCQYFQYAQDNKLVNYEQFLQYYEKKNMNDSKRVTEGIFRRIAKAVKNNNMNLKEVFDIIDADKSGGVNERELRDAFKGMKIDFTEDDLQCVLVELDKDKSGIINCKEFISYIQNITI